jgi:hypothetical protein
MINAGNIARTEDRKRECFKDCTVLNI